MHSPEFIHLIDEIGNDLGISVMSFSNNWSIRLKKSGNTKFIIGYTFPLNNSAVFKIARNKNVCSEILDLNDIPNVPHQLLFSPVVLQKRKSTIGNFSKIQEFIGKNKFPFIIKQNNTSGGDGVFMIKDEVELDNVLSKIYTKDMALCLSPFRVITTEYRNVILGHKCLITYKKNRPFIVGDGEKRVIDLFAEFSPNKGNQSEKIIYDENFEDKLYHIPSKGEIVYLTWKHNATLGTTYTVVNDPLIENLAISASKAIDATFVSVDIIKSITHGLEILEINATVLLNFFSAISKENYTRCRYIYQMAMERLFIK